MEQLDLLGSALLGGLGLLAALRYLSQTIRFTSRCPRCGDSYPERVPRKGLMKFTPTKAYHCCGKRFYQISPRKADEPQTSQVA